MQSLEPRAHIVARQATADANWVEVLCRSSYQDEYSRVSLAHRTATSNSALACKQGVEPVEIVRAGKRTHAADRTTVGASGERGGDEDCTLRRPSGRESRFYSIKAASASSNSASDAERALHAAHCAAGENALRLPARGARGRCAALTTAS